MDSFISSVITLALVMDGFGNIPLFIAALKKVAPERRKTVLIRELAIALIIMVAFLFLGKWFLRAFGIHEYSLSIAGGIILFIISVKLVFGGDEEPKNDPKEDEPFVVPLAIPLVAGPAALSMVMITAAQQSNKFITLGAVIVASIINSIILMASFPISNLLGKRGLIAIERLTGMILILMSVDMVMGGISTFMSL
ncbi:MarC family protein [Candidatus Avelusimicrobium fimicolum]|jgi:multiple antibiotic resistance protein|uniref:MarC family protein n=1 Tax=Candidatus Avelusimicrobium TaxID=2840538 RepID=UPI0015B09A17|nr:MarC family protein [Elusimicrobiaceae bacterium]